MKMKKAKDRQITFYADPDVYEWLKQQESVTRFLNTLIRSHMSNGQNAEVAKAAGSQLKTPRSDEHANQFMPEVTSTRALSSMVNELEQIQEAILKSYRRQQAMIGALRTHQSLFEKSATLYRELGRIRDEEEVIMEPPNEVVSSYNELLTNSAHTIKAIIASSEEDHQVIAQTGGIRERLIAAIETGDQTNRRDVDAPARSFSLKAQTPPNK